MTGTHSIAHVAPFESYISGNFCKESTALKRTIRVAKKRSLPWFFTDHDPQIP